VYDVNLLDEAIEVLTVAGEGEYGVRAAGLRSSSAEIPRDRTSRLTLQINRLRSQPAISCSALVSFGWHREVEIGTKDT
jgi:hypothetical protein